MISKVNGRAMLLECSEFREAIVDNIVNLSEKKIVSLQKRRNSQ